MPVTSECIAEDTAFPWHLVGHAVAQLVLPRRNQDRYDTTVACFRIAPILHASFKAGPMPGVWADESDEEFEAAVRLAFTKGRSPM